MHDSTNNKIGTDLHGTANGLEFVRIPAGGPRPTMMSTMSTCLRLRHSPLSRGPRTAFPSKARKRESRSASEELSYLLSPLVITACLARSDLGLNDQKGTVSAKGKR
jgi:hypothetical protein